MLEKVVILSTGDELTTGKIADTNAQWLADRCLTLGLDVVAVLVVGDFHERITWAWERAFELGDLVISTGGLGPTSDDLTTEITADRARVPVPAVRSSRLISSVSMTSSSSPSLTLVS